jgi:hypothetical protein
MGENKKCSKPPTSSYIEQSTDFFKSFSSLEALIFFGCRYFQALHQATRLANVELPPKAVAGEVASPAKPISCVSS